MARDARWPFIPLLVVRAVQGLFGLIVLATSGHVISLLDGLDPAWWVAFALVTGLFTLIWVAINFTLLFMGLLLPLAVVCVDAFLLVFWLVTVAGIGDSGYVSGDCTVTAYGFYFTETYKSEECDEVKAMFAFSLLNFFLFIAATAYAAFILHKNRKDLRGKKYAAENASGHPEGGNVVPMVTQPVEQKTEYYTAATPAPVQSPVYQEQGQQYYQQPVQPQQTYQQGPPAAFVSPTNSPPPVQPQGTGYSTVSGQTGRNELPGNQ